MSLGINDLKKSISSKPEKTSNKIQRATRAIATKATSRPWDGVGIEPKLRSRPIESRAMDIMISQSADSSLEESQHLISTNAATDLDSRSLLFGAIDQLNPAVSSMVSRLFSIALQAEEFAVNLAEQARSLRQRR
jgi:hypothetical protein